MAATAKAVSILRFLRPSQRRRVDVPSVREFIEHGVVMCVSDVWIDDERREESQANEDGSVDSDAAAFLKRTKLGLTSLHRLR